MAEVALKQREEKLFRNLCKKAAIAGIDAFMLQGWSAHVSGANEV
jgi:hypothetical protein